MSDVARKAITANPVKNGAIVQCMQKTGVAMDTDDETLATSRDPEALVTKYTNRFDDPRYYEGDTAS